VKKFRPSKVLLFVLLVLALLLIPSILIPKGGVNFLGVNWEFLRIENIFSPSRQESKDISNIIQKVDTSDINASLVKHKNGTSGKLGWANGGELSTESATSLHLNGLAKQNLFRFFEKLKSVNGKGKKMTIYHYGDSQIEGDRITGYVRQRIQNQFGGNGPGMIPAVNVYNTQTFKQSYSSNFERLTSFWGKKLSSKKYGAMASAAMINIDSGKSERGELTEAWIEIESSPSAFARAREYNHVKCYYSYCFNSCSVKVYENNKLIHEDSLIKDGLGHSIDLSFPKTPGKLKFVFSTTKSPVFNGFSLEGDIGVQVVNVAMRGSSGSALSAGDNALFKKMHNEQNTELFILQFGGNSVPAFKDSSSVRNYAKSFKGQIQYMQQVRPSAAIIVIGPSDMSHRVNGVFESYSLLPYCVSQMKKACDEAGAAYWDLFGAMGGKNSMPSWVSQGLAGGDYIHFTPKGSSYASQLFYDAFIAEYTKWLNGNPNTTKGNPK
jgi:lysophospholipase L1-like esterase